MLSESKKYLFIGSAKDFETTSGWLGYRLLEILPGALVWITFVLIIVASIFAPVWAVIFIVTFDLYWLLKTVYLSWHLRNSFRIMRELEKVNWLKKFDDVHLSSHGLGIKNWREDLWHLVILPFYKEGYDVLKTTCDGLIATQYPKERIMIVLSGEGRAGEEARLVGQKICAEYSSHFGKFLLTTHQDVPGELAGKGANETWAAREAKEKLVDAQKIPYEHIIVSVFDVDTVPSHNYFSRLSYLYLTSTRPLRTSYQPIPLFINNIWEAPVFSRLLALSSTFWHLLNQMRPERLVSFSSHAFPFKALVEIGFWQVNVVSEDSRIFWQALLTFDGDWRVEPLLVPVAMDANVAEDLWQTAKNLYKQQRRWAYGVADTPYFLHGFFHNKKIPLRTKLYWAFNQIESFWSWPTNSFMIFLMGWLPIFLGGSQFGVSVLAYNVPRITSWVLTLAMMGIITSIYLTLKILPPRPIDFGRHKYFWMIFQWFLVPVSLMFSSVPAIEAETRLMLGKYLGFWPTPKIRKGIQKVVFETPKNV